MTPPACAGSRDGAFPARSLTAALASAFTAFLAAAALASCLALSGCVASMEAGPPGPYAAELPERRVILVFEREASYTPLSGRKVSILLSSPAALVSPAGGSAVTGSGGEVEVVYRPVAVYDESALAAGDVVADFPATLFVSMDLGSDVFEWQVDDTLSYARYQDPLYRGLDRDPAPGPAYINLVLP
jgi:hypothetical protein